MWRLRPTLRCLCRVCRRCLCQQDRCLACIEYTRSRTDLGCRGASAVRTLPERNTLIYYRTHSVLYLSVRYSEIAEARVKPSVGRQIRVGGNSHGKLG